jgi:hypothetical protein
MKLGSVSFNSRKFIQTYKKIEACPDLDPDQDKPRIDFDI